jgi:hypothetical protein
MPSLAAPIPKFIAIKWLYKNDLSTHTTFPKEQGLMALEQELDKSMTLYGYEQGRPGAVPAVQPHRAPKVKDPAVTEMNFD